MDLSRFTSSGRLPADDLARQRAFFQATAPAFLADRYALRPADPGGLAFDGHGELINPCHGLGCRPCGGALHRVTMHLHGIATACADCGHAETLMGRPGDGVLRPCDCGAEARRVAVRLEYPGDLFASGLPKGQEAEFFTWVTLFADCPACGTVEALADAEA